MARGWAKEGSQKQRVAELLAKGLTADRIAERLGMTRKAVSARVSDLRRDLGDA